MSPSIETPILPAHIEDTIKAIARFHAEHSERATEFEKLIARTTAFAARPRFIAMLSSIVVFWALLNSLLSLLGFQALDSAPFFWLQGVVGLMALYMTTLILATQRREDELAGHREQLTLELAILSEQKTAKIIAMLQALRADDPHTPDVRDPEAEIMAEPADPQAVLDRIKLEGTGSQA